MKKLANLNGTKVLNKDEQQSINGGRAPICDYPEFACYCEENQQWSCSYNGYCD